MTRRPTIIDVARAAGVSKSTVSLVFQKSPSVKAETRAAVQQVMADLGYVYNRNAANLRSNRVGLIGLVINDLRNPFFAEFATSVQMALSARGYATVVANTDEDPGLQAQVVASMVEHGVAAMVISPAYGDEAATFGPLQRAGIPVMQVLRKVEPRTDLFPFAAPDYRRGGELAAQHLVAMGARRIAFVGGLEGRAVTAERMAGYLSTLAAHGLPTLALYGRASRAFGREVALHLAPEVDAALCFNDLVALGMLSGFAERGRSVGQGFRLAGFDDIEECAQAFPALTSVHCDIAGFAAQVAVTILSWAEAGILPAPETHTPVRLIVRASSTGAT
jgi:LacI family transcriptional regulator